MNGRPFDKFRVNERLTTGGKRKDPANWAPYVHMRYGTVCGFSAAVDIHSNVGCKTLADTSLHFSTSLSNLRRVAR